MNVHLLRGCVLLLCGMSSIAVAQELPHYAVIIGHNDSTDPNLTPLKYADDDAVRYQEVFSVIASETHLLTTLDKESERLYPSSVGVPPTRSAVLETLRTVRRQIQKDVQQGIQPRLTFIFSGHGSYDADGSGFLYLADDTFTTRDLYGEVIAPNQEAEITLIIDACNAALLVHSRGGGSDRVSSTPNQLKLEAYPNVGVILSSSSVGEVHEWGKYLSGVFSHEVRSGLLGPGDLDGDGRITFPELASFVAAANQAVDNPTIRLDPYIRPPLNNPSAALIDLERARFAARIRVEGELGGRGYLMDGRLLRYVDFHMPQATSFQIGLVHTSGGWMLVRENEEFRIPKGSKGTVHLSGLESRPLQTVASRGATSDYFEKTLFEKPMAEDFTNTFLEEEYVASLTVERAVLSPWYTSGWGWASTGVALSALGGALSFQMAATADQSRAESALFTPDREAANRDLRSHQMWAGGLAVAGGLALGGAITAFILDRTVETERYTPPFEVNMGPGGIQIQGTLP